MMLDDASGCNMVLVDFSEYIHSAEGLQDANVITIIDHHGDGSVTTGNQIIYDETMQYLTESLTELNRVYRERRYWFLR